MLYITLIIIVKRANNIVAIRTGKLGAQNKQHIFPLTVIWQLNLHLMEIDF